MKNDQLAYEALKEKAFSQLKTGKSLFGKDGAFAPVLKEFLETALEEELESHIDEQERQLGNRKNGKSSKQIKTSEGSIELSTPRDRKGNFDPQIIGKRETILAESLEKKIIGVSLL